MTEVGWSLNRDVWSAIANDAKSTPWRKVRFDYSSRMLVDALPGVYMVSLNAKFVSEVIPFSDLSTPIYIGQSSDLRQRFSTHTGSRGEEALWRRVGSLVRQTEFWFLSLPGKSRDELMRIEQSLIDAFGKKLNSINSVAVGSPIKARVRKDA